MCSAVIEVIVGQIKNECLVKKVARRLELGVYHRGVFMNFSQKSTLLLFLIEETNIYQMHLVPWKNIVPGRSYYSLLEVSTTIFEKSSWNF